MPIAKPNDLGKSGDGSSKRVSVHIDTTLQIERCKGKKKAEVVEDVLRQFRFTSTSTYAKLEFKRAWLRDLAYLYEISKNANRFEDVLAHVDDKLGAHPLSRRRVSRCYQAIVAFLSQLPTSVSYGAQLQRFRSHIRVAIQGAYPWWDRSVDHQFDGASCTRAREVPTVRSDGSIDVAIAKCKQSNITCTANAFFKSNRTHFDKIVSEIEGSKRVVSGELKAAVVAIRSARKSPNFFCDSTNCAKIADIIIALDGLKMDCFAANNDAEWQLISQALGKELINPVRPG